MTSTAVRVALRVRPLTQKERISNCTECISFIPDQPQILIGKDHSFTYDYVFDTNTEQQSIYNTSVVPLVEKFVDGFNATILAYGQTGSGKTYSMGTALEEHIDSEHQGIVPRFIHDLFHRLAVKKEGGGEEMEYQVLVSFLELYNEDLLDLLNPQSKKKCEVQIREDVNGNIYWAGVREEVCETPEELVKNLVKGSLGRTTGSTDMNSVSSRSHAIFSVILKQRWRQPREEKVIVSKFHFVDLAGSERLKRTNAQGDRAREGISINAGLLALGNVISALGDESRRSAHVPYRDSKLTRLLQDSLGGNSQTLMMACVSPSDTNFAETLSTLKYANRARNIKNKVAIQQEFAGSSVQVNQLRSQVARLTMELQALKSTQQTPSLGWMHHEELDRLKARVRAMSDDICRLTTERDTLLMERDLTGCDVESSPLIGQYQKTIQELRQALSETEERLAFSESVRAPLVQTMATLSPHVSHTSTSHRRRSSSKKKRPAAKTNTTKNVTFKSTKRSKSQQTTKGAEEEDIESWLKSTLGSIQTSESSGLRIDAKHSILNAKSQIDKALKVLDEFKTKGVEEHTEYDCDLLADDELFIRLQSDETLFGDMEEVGLDEAKASAYRSRMSSTETLMTDDTDFIHPHFHKILDQIQSDIQVSESLVNQLEKTELEYLQMRKQFESKIYALRDEILQLRQEASGTGQQQSMHDIRQAYEHKMKQLMNQLSDLRRKYAQTTSAIQSSRNQNESTLRALRVNVETLKVEKKRMIRRMKEEAERVKGRLEQHTREIQQLRKRQQRDAETRRKLEREAKQLESMLQKRTDESLVTAEKVKSLVGILKKAVKEGGVLDAQLLANAASLLDLGSWRKAGGRRSTTTMVKTPASVRAAQKKRWIDQALNQFIDSKQAAEEMRRLVSKRNDLAQKKEEYLSEREHLLQEEDKNMIPIDRAFRQVIDENIEMIEAEISYVNARIQAMNSDAAADLLQDEEDFVDMSARPVEKRVTFARHEDGDWQDMDAIEERWTLPARASPEQCIEMLSRILGSMEADELACVMECTLDDIVSLRMEEAQNKMMLQQYEKTTEDLRRTLTVMKKTALDATDDYEKRLKQVQRRRLSVHSSFTKLPYEDSLSDADSAIDVLPEDHYQHVESLFHKIYNEGIADLRRPSTPSTLAEAELSPYLQRRPSLQQIKMTSGAPMKPSASPLAGRRGSTSSPEQFLQQLLMSERRHSIQSDSVPPPPTPKPMVETASQQTRRRAFSFQQPPTAPSPIGQRRHSLLREIAIQQDFQREFEQDIKRRSPTNSNELRKSAAANNVFDRLSSGHTQASHAKKRLHAAKNRYSSSSIDDLRRQWSDELEKIKNVC
ncbi:hypothetical protein G6F46_010728 [Rhizopus delemar]|uniref:Kinesin motor domain-containing protein n=2 Tax=Rhizopus TaxID=4842 RepID=A0A9P7CKK3_9FUNG|nr:hypothetical protein G6F55_009950 [Rhizopus delemar]KAG1536809.1 hypothetical protein G6F51_010751 [Rhizopus arrhizus]KAG1494174.1 hypothetical protein G6F54_008063 [Rhizopus delemar]KAG1511328.1 hypothetical protein G6F53_006023 [Rhizopus delemar]KAG1520187.1 hypothetical protein G6F52_007902 [Rhizopus delemar]